MVGFPLLRVKNHPQSEGINLITVKFEYFSSSWNKTGTHVQRGEG